MGTQLEIGVGTGLNAAEVECYGGRMVLTKPEVWRGRDSSGSLLSTNMTQHSRTEADFPLSTASLSNSCIS
jgi:hypothetical protein